MISPILGWQSNNITWYEFHDSRNENSMNNITERVIRYYDVHEKIGSPISQLHQLFGSIKQSIEESIERMIKDNDYTNQKTR